MAKWTFVHRSCVPMWFQMNSLMLKISIVSLIVDFHCSITNGLIKANVILRIITGIRLKWLMLNVECQMLWSWFCISEIILPIDFFESLHVFGVHVFMNNENIVIHTRNIAHKKFKDLSLFGNFLNVLFKVIT